MIDLTHTILSQLRAGLFLCAIFACLSTDLHNEFVLSTYKVVVSKMEITTKDERPRLQKPGASLSKVAAEAAPRITST